MPKKIKGTSSAEQILGKVATKQPKPKATNICVVCLKTIPAARIEALVSMNTPPNRWTHVTCSTTTKIKGVYMGEVGTSEMKLCDKLYDDNVRSVFRRAEVDSGDGDESDDN